MQILQLLTTAVEATHFKKNSKGQEHVAEMDSGREKIQNVRPQRINCNSSLMCFLCILKCCILHVNPCSFVMIHGNELQSNSPNYRGSSYKSFLNEALQCKTLGAIAIASLHVANLQVVM